MFDQFKMALSEGPEVPLQVLALRLALSLLGGAGVAWLYLRTRNGSGAASLPTTLVMLAVLIAAVTQVIGDNIARAFSLVGALSIVRFRTVVRDTRDTAFVIFSVVAGMAIGAGHARVAVATLGVGGVAAWLMRSGRMFRAEVPEFDLTVRLGLSEDTEAFAREAFATHLASWKSTSAGTARQGSALEVSWLVTLRPECTAAEFVRALNRREGVQSVEVRSREDGN